MATSEEQITAVTANLNNIRGDVQRLNGLVVDLQNQAATGDAITAEKLQPLVDLSKQIADATPEPAPVDEPPATP